MAKVRNTFTAEQIEEIVNTVKGADVENLSKTITLTDFKNEGYLLAVNHYVDDKKERNQIDILALQKERLQVQKARLIEEKKQEMYYMQIMESMFPASELIEIKQLYNEVMALYA